MCLEDKSIRRSCKILGSAGESSSKSCESYSSPLELEMPTELWPVYNWT